MDIKMGRKKKNVVYRYVELQENNRSKCLYCGKILKTQHGANLVHHMKTTHKEKYEEIVLLNKSLTEKNSTEPDSDNSRKVLEECQNLVTVHGLPFQAMNYQALQNLISMIPNNSATVSAHSMRENVQQGAANMRHELAIELQEQMISMKVDIASLSTRSFMGINIQLIQSDQIILKNLAVIEIFERHTSEHLKELVLLTLLRYRIDIKQIYCTTTDNGANMIKMGRMLSEEGNTNSVIELENNDERSESYDSDDEISESDSVGDLLQEEISERITTSLRAHFDEPDELVNFKAGVVRCAAHTLQLAMQDACRECRLTNILTSARNFVKLLRSQNFVLELRRNKLNIPKLESNTRWHSTVDMVESLLALKDFCAQDERLELSTSTWDELEEFVKSMTPGKVLTKKLQKEQLTVGDFYLAWMSCQFELTAINTRISNMVLTKMTERQNLLFENEIFITGIYLDPRVSSILTTDQRKQAIENLVKIYNRLTEIKLQYQENHDPIVDQSQPCTSSSTPAIHSGTSSIQNSLTDFLNSSYMQAHDNINTLVRSNRSELTNNLKRSADAFFEETLVDHSVDVLKWWQNNQDRYPLLYKLTKIVLAVPMTQVSVERLFSSLKFIVSHKRYSLKADVIEDILLIRSNKLYNKDQK